MPAHYRNSPSGASKWSACPGSLNAEAGYPDTSSEAADEGTAAHDFVHTAMRMGLDLSDFVGEVWTSTGYELKIDQEVVNLLQPGVDRFDELCNDGSGNTPDIELKIPLDPWLPGQKGTLDRGYAGRDEIVISDLKWGRGVPVSPERNKQLALYALGYWHSIARHKTQAGQFRFIIDQPRNSAGGGEWTVSLNDLLTLGDELKAAAVKTQDPNAPRIASTEACTFCKAKPGCKEYAAWNLKIVSQDFEDLDAGILLDEPPHLVMVAAMSPARLRYVWQHAGAFRSWLGEVEKQCAALVSAENPEIGMKYVLGKPGDREWADPEQAAKLVEAELGDEAYIKKLRSVTQTEKTLDRRTFAKMLEVPEGQPPVIRRAPGKPTLALADDPRPAAENVADMFDDVSGDD